MPTRAKSVIVPLACSLQPMSLFGPVSNLGNQIRPFTRSYTQLVSIQAGLSKSQHTSVFLPPGKQGPHLAVWKRGNGTGGAHLGAQV